MNGTALAVVWGLIYTGSFVVVIYTATKSKIDPLATSMNAAAYLINILAPAAAIYFFQTQVTKEMSPISRCNGVDVVIVIHVVLTFVAAFILLIWSVTLIMKAMGPKNLRAGQKIAVLSTLAMALVTIVVASWFPDWFISRQAYDNRNLITFVWPDTINAPITYFRAALAMTISAVPFIRRMVESGT